MGIGKSRGTSPLNVSNMLEEVEINQQIEAEKSEVDSRPLKYPFPANSQYING